MFPDNTYATITFLDDERTVSLLLQSFGFFLFFFVLCSSAFAQWTNNTAQNTRLVVNTSDPINISTLPDSDNGFFIVWEDTQAVKTSDIKFLHVNKTGKPDFRADGKQISVSPGSKSNPVTASSYNNTIVVLWRDFSEVEEGSLYAQRVDARGYLLWGETGLELAASSNMVSDYSLTCDKDGFSHSVFLSKQNEPNQGYSIIYQKISPDGRKIYPADGVKVITSLARKGMTEVVDDNTGGVFIFWTESINHKTVINAQHIDSKGKLSFKKPLIVSGQNSNVLKYTTKKVNNGSAYIVWQVPKGDASVMHQLINSKGIHLWKENGLPVIKEKHVISNPQPVINGNDIFLSWTGETDNSKDIYLQKYNLNGKELWTENGIRVTTAAGDQFGQKITTDEAGNIFVSWIDRRIDSLTGNIFTQKINSSGIAEWKDNGIQTCSFTNSLKSYLSIVPDRNKGVIVVFKDNREKQNNIYAQKIFSNGTFISHITNFYTELIGDSVRISWQTANEIAGAKYNIERTSKLDESGTYWSIIETLSSNGSGELNLYNFYDRPLENGTFYYRVTQSSPDNFTQASEIIRLNYLENSSEITVAQNNPNPFSDSTVISFYLPERMQVTLEFFDLRIEKVGEIIKEQFPAGTSRVTFVARNLPSGIYFYRFKAGDVVEVKKMVVSR